MKTGSGGAMKARSSDKLPWRFHHLLQLLLLLLQLVLLIFAAGANTTRDMPASLQRPQNPHQRF
jgi:hypothetical protein